MRPAERLVLVLCEPPLQDAARQDSEQAMLLVDDRHALGVLGLEEAERLLERHVRPDREVRRLGDRAELRRRRVEPQGDHLAHERLPRDDADEPLVLGHVDGADLGPLKELSRSLCRRVRRELPRVRHHRVADRVHGKIPRA